VEEMRNIRISEIRAIRGIRFSRDTLARSGKGDSPVMISGIRKENAVIRERATTTSRRKPDK